jgi:hypothetical protein
MGFRSVLSRSSTHTTCRARRHRRLHQHAESGRRVETAIREGYQRFKAEKNAQELIAIAGKHGLPTHPLQNYVDSIRHSAMRRALSHEAG